MTEFIRNLFHQSYFVCFLAILTCFCFYFLNDNSKKRFRKIVWTAYILLFISSLSIFIVSTINRYYNPQVWDFGAWYLYGKTAVQGYNFYLPENFNTVFTAIHHTIPNLDYSGFIESAVNVGFPYPPPTILYFAPLGFFSYKAAYIIWTLFTMIFVFADVYLIYSLFFKLYKLKGLLIVSILFFIFLPTLSTISFSQTNFFLLFYLLLMKKYQDNKFAGIFLALAVITKPYMIVFVLFFLFRKQWGVLLYFILSNIVFNGLIFILYGKDLFISYIFNNPSHRVPARVFSENVNQSLNAVLIRNNLITVNQPIIYIIIAGIFLATIVCLFYLIKRKLYNHMWAIILLTGLLIYPGTLSHYGVLLLFITFQFFNKKEELGFKPYFTIPIIATFYFLSTISVFSSICFVLILIVLHSFQLRISSTSS